MFTFQNDKGRRHEIPHYQFCIVSMLIGLLAGCLMQAPAIMAQASVFEDKMTKEEADVWRTVEAFNEAFQANDLDSYFSFVANSITIVTPGNPYRVQGILDDREEIQFGLTQGYGTVGLWRALQPWVQVFDDMAVVSFYSRGYLEAGSEMFFLKVTDVLIREKQEWKVVHIHVSK